MQRQQVPLQRQRLPPLRTLRIAAIAAALGIAGPAAASGPFAGGGLHGIVTGRTDGLGMPSVSVTLRSLPSPSTQVAARDAPWVEVRSTDTEGVFRFDDIPAGLYAMEAHLDGRAWSSFEPILVVPGFRLHEHIVLGDPSTSPTQPQT